MLGAQGEPEGENIFSEFPHFGVLEGKRNVLLCFIYFLLNYVRFIHHSTMSSVRGNDQKYYDRSEDEDQ